MVRNVIFLALFALSTLSTMSLANVGSSTAALADRSPLGQTTFLRIDTSGSRTSSMVRSGSLDRTVTTEDRSNPADPHFIVKNHCKVSILFMGNREGTVMSQVRGFLFTAEFLNRLRAGEIYETPDLKIRHLGYKDARNSDGRTYAHADEIFIYDVNSNGDAGGFGLNCLSASLLQAAQAQVQSLGQPVNALAGIENLQIKVLMHADAPVLGEVKLDMTGIYDGNSVKMGGDYIVRP